MVSPVTIFTGIAAPPTSGGRYKSSGVRTRPPPIPRSPERNDATSPAIAVMASSVMRNLYIGVTLATVFVLAACAPREGVVTTGGPAPGVSQTAVCEALDVR